MSHDPPKRLSNPPTVDALRDIGLFGALSDDVLEYLVQALPVVLKGPGDAVFREGDQAREMFVVLDGECEVLKRGKRGVEARVALLGPGDWFGEMSILDVQPRSATVIALAPSRLLRIGAEGLDQLYRRDLKAYSLIVLNIARELSRRLRVADGLIADIMANVLDEYVSSSRRR
ncbi:MAG: cyclic nucleotide-binding domain-containing protein [Myxococcales bacterium]|nr:cyclic nucleotide-binding domain-containing protein [Myxococcales bacterium]